jgi:RimJ/RimL family protein N-acetyltransferase
MQRICPQWAVVRWLTSQVPWPYPADGAAAHVAAALSAIARGEKMSWAITLKGGDALRGVIDLVAPCEGQHTNRGFWLDPALHRQGLMTEAADAVTGYAFEILGWSELLVANAVGNHASAHLKARQGAIEIGRAPAAYVGGATEQQIWRLTADAWRARTVRAGDRR